MHFFLQNPLIYSRDLAFIISQACFSLFYVTLFLSSGRLGPMVTCTLKLGISILNGGNVQVQQVWLYSSSIKLYSSMCPICHQYKSTYINYMYPYSMYRHYAGEAFGFDSRMFNVFLLSYPRKCLITWKRKEMQAFSRVCQDWCSLAGAVKWSRPQKGTSSV